jgi:hypothetical protein
MLPHLPRVIGHQSVMCTPSTCDGRSGCGGGRSWPPVGGDHLRFVLALGVAERLASGPCRAWMVLIAHPPALTRRGGRASSSAEAPSALASRSTKTLPIPGWLHSSSS